MNRKQWDELDDIVFSDEVKELIVATSFTPQGETTALFLEKIFKDKKKELSKTYVILIFTSYTTQKLSIDLWFIFNLKIYNLIY